MNNYQYCAHWMSERATGRLLVGSENLRVLDYGCGAGQLVQLLRDRNIAASGCDVFYDGGDYSPTVNRQWMDSGVIRRMDGGHIPFDDATFDYVINNQVMEHVVDMEAVLAEIQRVLKPGGTVLSLFPDKGVWREGHCGVPFLHWFPKQSRPRIAYAALVRALGFGYNKDGKGVMQWSRFQCDWLDQWTHYRSLANVHSNYNKFFEKIRHIEEDWFRLRVGPDRPMAKWLPAPMQRVITKRLGFLVMVANKAG